MYSLHFSGSVHPMVVLVLPSGRFEGLGKIYVVLVTVFSDASGTFSLLKYPLLSSLGLEDWIRVL